MIDHALLNPTLTTDQLDQGIQTAIQYDVATVCIMPFYLTRCMELLKASDVQACTTIGFPHGANTTAAKAAEAKQSLLDGAREIDFVVNINQVLSGNWNYVRDEIRSVIEIIHDQGKKAKVIFENCYLNDPQKIRLCEICSELNADWVKTSTGFGRAGATIEDVKLMRKHALPGVQIKASGGIRTLASLLSFHEAGATRIGCSAIADILEESRRSQLSKR